MSESPKFFELRQKHEQLVEQFDALLLENKKLKFEADKCNKLIEQNFTVTKENDELKQKLEFHLDELHHNYRARLATLEGLFLITVAKKHPYYKKWVSVFEQARKEMEILTYEHLTIKGDIEIEDAEDNLIDTQ